MRRRKSLPPMHTSGIEIHATDFVTSEADLSADDMIDRKFYSTVLTYIIKVYPHRKPS